MTLTARLAPAGASVLHNCNDKREDKKWSTFRGFNFCRLKRLHEHFFAPDHQLPHEHANRDGIVRAAACALQIAAFYNYCPKFAHGPSREVIARCHRAAVVILQHARSQSSWYYRVRVQVGGQVLARAFLGLGDHN